MTEILAGVARSLLEKTSTLPLPGDPEQDWRHQAFSHMPALASQWPDGHASRMGGMQDVDLSIFQHDAHRYQDPYSNAAHLVSTSFAYYGEVNLPSDVEMPTPSTATFPPDATESYFPQGSTAYLRPPTGNDSGSVSTQSPLSAQSDISPRQHAGYADHLIHTTHRPALSRSVTAPDPLDPPVLKRTGTSEDDDEEYIPAAGSKGRGRKRQRIPHTAVERRYRENLNAHLDRLRQSVPAFATRAPGSKTGGTCTDGNKPSKCEILNGAIGHICALDKENQMLRDEVRMLKLRIDDVERWHRHHSA
ncbi:hypothetical protein LTR53_010853 [Teratosphaeriaceae sp. CCFEE 6253]|nr:hypothetical protein LTR53_010853 [Teratosphaeriaceae sp. CCFEE 6253]